MSIITPGVKGKMHGFAALDTLRCGPVCVQQDKRRLDQMISVMETVYEAVFGEMSKPAVVLVAFLLGMSVSFAALWIAMKVVGA